MRRLACSGFIDRAVGGRLLIVGVYLLNLYDVAITVLGLQAGLTEANRWMAHLAGTPAGSVFKMAVVGFICGLWWRVHDDYPQLVASVAVVACAGYGLLAVTNTVEVAIRLTA